MPHRKHGDPPRFPLFMEDCFSLPVTREVAFLCELLHRVATFLTHLAGINAEGAVLRQKTSRQLAATQHFGRFRSEADID